MIARPTLVFTTGLDPFQVLINVSTLSEAGHVAIGLGDHLLHAYEKGVVYEPREVWFTGKRQRLVRELEILPDVSEGVARCMQHIGEPYDVGGVLRTALRILLSRLQSPVVVRPNARISSHTCASFAMLLDPEGARIPEWRGVHRGTVTPADLLEVAGPSFQPAVREL